GRNALVDERVEAVETTETGLAEGAAFWGVGVDVVEVLEVCRILRGLIVERDRMLGGGEREAGKTQQDEAAAMKQKTAQRVCHRAFSVDFSHQVRRPSV